MSTAWRIARMLLLAQWREQPVRLGLTVFAIGIGVALSVAVFLVNGAALNEFGLAAKKLVGEADVVVRGPRAGFAETIFVRLARDPAVSDASPVLDLEVAVAGSHDALEVLGLDVFRAASLQPALTAELAGNTLALFEPNAICLSAGAAARLAVARGDTLQVIVGSRPKRLRVACLLSKDSYPQPLGIMDIASAAWTLERLGTLNRVDLRLKPGVDVAAFRAALQKTLPAGVLAVAPQVERDRARSVTRAYRVNLNVLALVSLWTGAFLVFSTQALSVLRRRRSLALLRALGVTRRQLESALTGEGVAIGLLGSVLGVAGGAGIAIAVLDLLAGDLGSTQMRAVQAPLNGAALLPMLGFMLLGTGVAAIGAWLPARAAARQAPAQGLKGGDPPHTVAIARSRGSGLVMLALGGALCFLPSVAGLPIAGYIAIAMLLFGAILWVPSVTAKALELAPRTGRVPVDLGLAQLRDNVALSTLSLSSVIVSFSLMVAMAIMVFSFRLSFDQWLIKLLPADLQLRQPQGNDTAFWDAGEQARIARIPGVARAEFRRTLPVLLDPARPAVYLIARGESAAEAAAQIPLVSGAGTSAPVASAAPAAPRGAGDAGRPERAPSIEPAWISEALQDLYGYRVGDLLELPLGGAARRFVVAGVWRDYARSTGSVVISRAAYREATGDAGANEGSLWLAPGAEPAAVETAIRSAFARGDSFEILTSGALRERSLQIFDHAFAVTYALEAIAVAIGLVGIGFAAGSTALARRAEFGVLRHIGLARRQILALLATEGTLTSAFGVLYGLALGMLLSVVLVFVINRQSFNWSIDLAIPGRQLAVLSALLIAAAAIAAMLGGRAATGGDAVNAVREDW